MAHFEIQKIVPGKSLTSFEPSKFAIAGMRIDNPSGCWYRVKNNGRIIPPWTLGTQVLCIPNFNSVTVEFLASFAGQSSKIIGNDVTVLLTDVPLPDEASIAITNAIPYVNTYVCEFEVTANSDGLWSIFPTQFNTRLQLVHVGIHQWGVGAGDVSGLVSVYATSTAGTAAVTLHAARDGDPLNTGSAITRGPYNVAVNDPTLLNFPHPALDTWAIRFSNGTLSGPWVKDWEATGPDMPPSAYSSSTVLRGLAIDRQLQPWGASGATFTIVVVYTEEILQ